ncbi:Coenzyme A biosynthesis bifunctional protein CoaBC [compost metagenome]
MSRGAKKFVEPITFRGVTGNDPIIEVWEEPFPKKVAHVYLADIADAIVIVPATAHFIAKHANGLADDMLTNVLLATNDSSKVIFCPAMNVNMYNHPATKRNIKILEEYGINILPPEIGHLVCGYEAEGKLPSTPIIVECIRQIIK